MSKIPADKRPLLITSLLALVQNQGRVTANLGTWDGDCAIREGDFVLVTDAGAGPYEAIVEAIEGSRGTLARSQLRDREADFGPTVRPGLRRCRQ